jgi:hypothetical protein
VLVRAIIVALNVWSHWAMISNYSSTGGTLAIFIPTNSGLVVAADMRQSPEGIFCDGINKILIPKRPPRTAVVVTGPATSLNDLSKIPRNEICAYLAQHPAPIDFGRSTVDFLESQNVPLGQFNGNHLSEKMYGEIQHDLMAGHLRKYTGTRLAVIIVSEFEPANRTSRIITLGVDLTGPVGFQLQPLPLTNATTVHGDAFGPEDGRVVLPFGEGEYFSAQVLAGPGSRYLSDAYAQMMQKAKISDIDADLATAAAVNLIDATSRMTEIVPAPSGIGGGISAVLLGNETKIIR